MSVSAKIDGMVQGSGQARVLRQLRERAGISQTELALRLGVPATVLSAYERGHRQPGIDVFFRAVHAAGFEVRYVQQLDPETQGRRLVEVLELADALPYRATPMSFAHPPARQWRTRDHFPAR